MPDQRDIADMGGTMRLGVYDCQLVAGTHAFDAYANVGDGPIVQERHRHRFEFNNEYKAALENAGLWASGINPDSGLVEIVELREHPWFVGVQFHPELKSRVEAPHPLFSAFVKAALKYHQNKTAE